MQVFAYPYTLTQSSRDASTNMRAELKGSLLYNYCFCWWMAHLQLQHGGIVMHGYIVITWPWHHMNTTQPWMIVYAL